MFTRLKTFHWKIMGAHVVSEFEVYRESANMHALILHAKTFTGNLSQMAEK